MSSGQGEISVLYADRLDTQVTHPATVVESTGDIVVTVAETVEAALAAFEDATFDCVVTSMDLADGDPRELLTAIRDREPTLPVVLVSRELLDDPLLDEPALRFVQGTAGTAVGRVVASQIESLLARPGTGTTSLAGVPKPAFIYDEGIVDWNEQFRALVGHEDEWLVDRPLADVIDCTPSDLAAAVDEGTPREVTVAGADGPAEQRFLSVGRDGERYVCVLDGAAGAGDGEIPRAESILTSLLSAIPLAIYVKDERGRHVAVSHHQVGMSKDHGIDNDEGKVHHVPDDVLGKTDFDLYPPEDAERYVETDERVMEATDTFVTEEHAGIDSNDEAIALRDMKAPWCDEEGDVTGVIGVTLDVTEKYLTRERAESREEVLETIETILRKQIRPLLEEPVSVEDDTVDDLQGALADVGTLLQTRSLPAVAEPTEVSSRAAAAWEGLDTDDATLQVQSQSVADAAPELFQAVFAELLENTLIHAGPGVTVTVGDLDDGFYVEDDGPGIAPGRHGEVRRYGSTTADDRIGGGLAVVDAIVRAHGWSMKITTGIDGGTRIEIEGVQFH